MERSAGGRGDGNLQMSEIVLLWAIVLLELLSPVPAALTFGAIYVLAVRPPAFLDLVERLYGKVGATGAGG
ncbi:MAG: hypothetical protein OES32_06990 [Acidobacteriota bacterium]|nr:hypothetical protein [Acidobacteriota bacterium]MDH3523316.1 hypothetical protein [Acidobacteriota bacterium]